MMWNCPPCAASPPRYGPCRTEFLPTLCSKPLDRPVPPTRTPARRDDRPPLQDDPPPSRCNWWPQRSIRVDRPVTGSRRRAACLLQRRALASLPPRHAVRKAEVVPRSARTCPGLAARRFPARPRSSEPSEAAIHRGRQAGGPPPTITVSYSAAEACCTERPGSSATRLSFGVRTTVSPV